MDKFNNICIFCDQPKLEQKNLFVKERLNPYGKDKKESMEYQILAEGYECTHCGQFQMNNEQRERNSKRLQKAIKEVTEDYFSNEVIDNA